MYVMVLNDGETYSELSGCRIINVLEGHVVAGEEVEDFIKGVIEANEKYGSELVIAEFK